MYNYSNNKSENEYLLIDLIQTHSSQKKRKKKNKRKKNMIQSRLVRTHNNIHFT